MGSEHDLPSAVRTPVAEHTLNPTPICHRRVSARSWVTLPSWQEPTNHPHRAAHRIGPTLIEYPCSPASTSAAAFPSALATKPRPRSQGAGFVVVPGWPCSSGQVERTGPIPAPAALRAADRETAASVVVRYGCEPRVTRGHAPFPRRNPARRRGNVARRVCFRGAGSACSASVAVEYAQTARPFSGVTQSSPVFEVHPPRVILWVERLTRRHIGGRRAADGTPFGGPAVMRVLVGVRWSMRRVLRRG